MTKLAFRIRNQSCTGILWAAKRSLSLKKGKKKKGSQRSRQGGTSSENKTWTKIQAKLASGQFRWYCQRIGALFLLVLIAYIPVFRAGIIWDDHLVMENEHIRTLGGVWRIWTEAPLSPEEDVRYWPVFYSSFWVDHHIWGERAGGYHFDNVVLHGLNVTLLWRLLLSLKVPGAWLAAAVFAVHPIQVETVAWIIERKGLLASLFFLLAGLAFLRFERLRDKRFYIMALAFFTLSVLGKPVTVVFPVVVLLWLYWKGKSFTKRRLIHLVPFFLVALWNGLFNMHLASKYDPVNFGYSTMQRLVIAGRSTWFYLGKTLCPVNLMTIYPKWQLSPLRFWHFLFPIGVTVLILVLWAKRSQLGKAPLVAVLFFIIVLSPTSGLLEFSFMAHSFVADRYQYLASAGLIAFFVSAATVFSRRQNESRKTFTIAMAGLLLLFFLMTWHRASDYRDMESLFADNVKKNPNAPTARDNLGLALLTKGRYREAESHLRASLAIQPDLAEARNNLGLTLAYQGKDEEAIEEYQRLLQKSPDYAIAHANLGNALARLARFDEAAQHFVKAIESDAECATAHYGLGVLSLQVKTPEEAIPHLSRTVEIDPRFSNAYNNLGVAYEMCGNLEQAIKNYRQALSVNPSNRDADRNLSNALNKQG